MLGNSQKQSDAWHHLHNPQVREVFFGGGARSGKSILLCIHEIAEAVGNPGTRGLVAREDFTALQDSTMKTFFEEVLPWFGYKEGQHYKYNGQDKLLTWANGSETMFRHMKYQPSDPNYSRIGSTAYTRVSIDEADEVDERLVSMLRARTGYRQPPHGGKMLITGNPGEYWTKYRYVYDKNNKPVEPHPERRVVLSTVADNPDPVVRAQYTKLMEELSPYDKERLLYGNWLAAPQSGREFFWAFSTSSHVKDAYRYDPTKALHIGFDFNSAPYMTLVVFQIHKVGIKYIMQGIKEYCLEHPLATTEAICRALQHDMLSGDFAGHKAGLFYYGDYSGKNKSPMERDGIAHNYDTVDSILARHLSPASNRLMPNPLHARVSKWINHVFKGSAEVEIYISPKMSNTARDFALTKMDADGSILKEYERDRVTGDRYEKHGHCAQASYYIACSAFHAQFMAYVG